MLLSNDKGTLCGDSAQYDIDSTAHVRPLNSLEHCIYTNPKDKINIRPDEISTAQLWVTPRKNEPSGALVFCTEKLRLLNKNAYDKCYINICRYRLID